MFLFRCLSSSPMKYTSYEKKPRFVLLFFFFSLLFYTSYMLYFDLYVCTRTYQIMKQCCKKNSYY
jgi:hypothetical protein